MVVAHSEESLHYLGSWSLFSTFLALTTGPSLPLYSLFFAIASALYLWKALGLSRATGVPLTVRGQIATVACPLVLIWIVTSLVGS